MCVKDEILFRFRGAHKQRMSSHFVSLLGELKVAYKRSTTLIMILQLMTWPIRMISIYKESTTIDKPHLKDINLYPIALALHVRSP